MCSLLSTLWKTSREIGDVSERDVEELRDERIIETVSVSQPQIFYGKKRVREQREQ